MRWTIPTLTFSALLTLTACAHSLTGIKTRDLPEVPADLQACFDQRVKVPGKQGTPLTRRQAHQLITALWASDANKTRCGRRLLAFITNLRVPP